MDNKAKVLEIYRTKKCPSSDGDTYRTFDNGIDLFGPVDTGIDKIRMRYGEEFCGFRLMLMRKTKSSPILMKLWMNYTMLSTEDTIPCLTALSAGLAAAVETCEAMGGNAHIDAHLVDWRPTGGEPVLEYNFEVIGEWQHRNGLVTVAKDFTETVDKKLEEFRV